MSFQFHSSRIGENVITRLNIQKHGQRQFRNVRIKSRNLTLHGPGQYTRSEYFLSAVLAQITVLLVNEYVIIPS